MFNKEMLLDIAPWAGLIVFLGVFWALSTAWGIHRAAHGEDERE